jgi:hypothetical protein
LDRLGDWECRDLGPNKSPNNGEFTVAVGFLQFLSWEFAFAFTKIHEINNPGAVS